MAVETTMGEEMSDFVTRLLLEHQPYMKLHRVYDCAHRCKRIVEEHVAMLQVSELQLIITLCN
jgi:hypothetical protein